MRNKKILLILRHAKSSWKHPDLQDSDRPLNKRGKRDAPRMGKLLKELDLIPDLIISSDAKRAKDTAKAVGKSFGYEGRVELNSSLYGADFNAYLEAIRLVPDKFGKVMLIVGHNPALEELVLMLTNKTESMPTCALARIDLEIKRWSDISKNIEGQLINIWRPRELQEE